MGRFFCWRVMEINDQYFMKIAIDQAKQATATWQNPQVGAVVVKDGEILASGHTQRFGGPHAERDALTKLTSAQTQGATLYVTLEPCNHYGKQPPCTQLIIDRGIKRVVIAETDPHSLVTGKGIAQLRQHGITVVIGVSEQAAAQVNPHYNFFFRHGRPWITLKQAISLDHRVSAGPGQRTVITNRAVYDRVHQERARFQGIVIGSTTAIVDNPTLVPQPQPAFMPVRIVLDRRGRLADHPQLKLLHDGLAPTWVFTASPTLADRLSATTARVFCLPTCGVEEVVAAVAKEGLQSLYVEGGPTIHRAFAAADLVEEVTTYIGPQMLGQNGVAAFTPPVPWSFLDRQVELLGDNVRITERKQEHV